MFNELFQKPHKLKNELIFKQVQVNFFHKFCCELKHFQVSNNKSHSLVSTILSYLFWVFIDFLLSFSVITFCHLKGILENINMITNLWRNARWSKNQVFTAKYLMIQIWCNKSLTIFKKKLNGSIFKKWQKCYDINLKVQRYFGT